jgi:hypothetical protein
MLPSALYMYMFRYIYNYAVSHIVYLLPTVRVYQYHLSIIQSNSPRTIKSDDLCPTQARDYTCHTGSRPSEGLNLKV